MKETRQSEREIMMRVRSYVEQKKGRQEIRSRKNVRQIAPGSFPLIIYL